MEIDDHSFFGSGIDINGSAIDLTRVDDHGRGEIKQDF